MKEDLNAEAGEGRAQTKENIGQNHTNPTQGGTKGVSRGLAGVRQAAQARKGERFTALLHHLTQELLRSSLSCSCGAPERMKRFRILPLALGRGILFETLRLGVTLDQLQDAKSQSFTLRRLFIYFRNSLSCPAAHPSA
jgi:hypothetical protein